MNTDTNYYVVSLLHPKNSKTAYSKDAVPLSWWTERSRVQQSRTQEIGVMDVYIGDGGVKAYLFPTRKMQIQFLKKNGYLDASSH
jgi:hypothetical protein